MTLMKPALRAAVLAAVFAGTGCAQNTRGPVPITSLDGMPCASAPDLAAASPLQFNPEKAAELTIDGATNCLQPPGAARRVYAVFLLPDSTDPYFVTVSSVLKGRTLLSPRMMILDAQGKVLRERDQDAFTFRGAALSAGLRTYPGDRYLLVTSDPASVGRQVSQISSTTHSTALATGNGAIFIGTGADTSQIFTYAHNGALVVSVRALPPAN
jgi:hypothetical protein